MGADNYGSICDECHERYGWTWIYTGQAFGYCHICRQARWLRVAVSKAQLGRLGDGDDED